jgi:DNA invertase Pin-like site-specific DNA recombinase
MFDPSLGPRGVLVPAFSSDAELFDEQFDQSSIGDLVHPEGTAREPEVTKLNGEPQPVFIPAALPDDRTVRIVQRVVLHTPQLIERQSKELLAFNDGQNWAARHECSFLKTEENKNPIPAAGSVRNFAGLGLSQTLLGTVFLHHSTTTDSENRNGTPMLIGYARVSTNDQNLDLQRDALTAAGCQKIFTDTISGAKASRPGLDQALGHLRDGDTLVVWKLDRLGRSVKNLIGFTDQLEHAGIGFRSLTDQIDTTTPAGRFFFHVMASLAQMERELTVERTRAGLEAAGKNGRLPGRKRLMTERKITAARQLLAQGTSAADVAHNIGVSIPTLYRWIPATDR